MLCKTWFMKLKDSINLLKEPEISNCQELSLLFIFFFKRFVEFSSICLTFNNSSFSLSFFEAKIFWRFSQVLHSTNRLHKFELFVIHITEYIVFPLIFVGILSQFCIFYVQKRRDRSKEYYVRCLHDILCSSIQEWKF